MTNFDLILPFLRPIEDLIRDEGVSEVMVNGDGSVFVERDGIVSRAPVAPLRGSFVSTAVKTIARLLQDDIGVDRPLLNSRLQDGSRVAAVWPATSVDGVTLVIRKFRRNRLTADELVERRMLTAAERDWLAEAVRKRQTILISGGTGCGKTSLLNALAAYLPANDRVVLIEDTSEVVIGLENVVRLEARVGDGVDCPAVTIRDLVKHTLRLRPDRIILGEVRGAEAFDLMQALNFGHRGTLSTIHANSAALALSRLRTCVAMAGVGLPDAVVARSIGDVIQVVAHIERREGHRVVAEIIQVRGYDAARDVYRVADWRTTWTTKKSSNVTRLTNRRNYGNLLIGAGRAARRTRRARGTGSSATTLEQTTKGTIGSPS